MPRHPRTTQLVAAVIAIGLVFSLAGCFTVNQTKMVRLLNDSRSHAGLRSVRANETATAKAQAWAAHMSRTGVVEHTGGGDRMDTSRLPRWCAAAENVAKATSLDNAQSLWMRSAPHKRNILGPYDHVGTGAVRKGTYVYAVQIFYRAC